jgi:hypothetical protein
MTKSGNQSWWNPKSSSDTQAKHEQTTSSSLIVHLLQGMNA